VEYTKAVLKLIHSEFNGLCANVSSQLRKGGSTASQQLVSAREGRSWRNISLPFRLKMASLLYS
jgi:hypothetical protein